MPSLRADAMAGVPDRETLEYLFSKRNDYSKNSLKTKPLQEINLSERLATNLVTLRERTVRINGDPFGILTSWAGNVGHPGDARMYTVMPPLFERLREYSIHGTEGVLRLQTFLKSVPNMGLEELATAFACDGKFNVTHSEMVQSDCTFKLGSMTVRIMQMHDIDLKIPATFKTCARAIGSEKKIEEIFPELPMPIKAQQYMMAQDLQASGDILPEKEGPREKRMAMLRASCQERFWTQLSPSERNNLNQVSEEPSSDLKPALTEIKKFWPSRWNNGRFDLDHYRQYLRDHAAAEKIWKLVEEDIFIIADRHMQVLFVNVENLGQLLFGQEAMDLMQRTIDLWSFFTPLPRPEDQRHVVDNYVRKIHPELDVSRATVDQLPRAKMCIAHLGCWASRPGDRQGRWMLRTSDSNFNRNNTMGFSQTLFPGFYTSVLGTAGKMIRFLLEPLDPDHFRECQEIFQGLDDSHKMPHGEGEDNFLSLFALGINPYTQRHKDKNDITDGMAGLVTLGSYVGGNLCIPLFGCKVPYKPGAVSLIRGHHLEHLVVDFTGPRYFIVGTNHESAKQSVWRKLGRSPPLSSDDHNDVDHENFDEDDPEVTCVNMLTDDDDDRELSNFDIHGTGTFIHSSSSDSTTKG